MQHHRPRTGFKHFTSFTARPWASGLVLGMTCLGGAWAQQQQQSATDTANDPYYIGAGIGWSHDSNVLRQSSNASSDSWITSTLLGGINKPFGRQKFYLDANISDNRYQDHKSLNNTGYGLNTGLDWSTVNNLSGGLRYGATQNLANQAVAGFASTGRRNSEKTQSTAADVRYGFSSKLNFDGGLQHRSVDFSDPAFKSQENKQDIARFGFTYGTSGLLILGAGLRFTETDTPDYSPAGSDETDRRDLDLTVDWSPSGLSTLTGRLSFSDEEHSRATAANFSGITGAVNWRYRPTGKLTFNTSYTRDTGSEARFIGFVGGTTPLASESYRITNTLQGEARYAITSKIESNLILRRTRGSVLSGNVAAGNETTDTFLLGATYNATRSIFLSCQIGRESRSTNSVFSTAYDSNTAACMARFTLR